MKDCEHKWIITEWVVNNEEFSRPEKRYCKKCGKKQSINYLGGDMWKWEDEFPPKHIYEDEGQPDQHIIKPLRISKRVADRIKYALILGVLLTTFYAFFSFNQGSFMSFFGSQAFIYVALSYVFIYILWQGINNQFSKFPIEIIKTIPQKRRQKQTITIDTTERRAALFSMIGYTLSMAFTIMVMIFLAVAHLSGTGTTIVVWDHFGEMTFETILFVCAFIVIFIGFYFTFKRFKQVVHHT